MYRDSLKGCFMTNVKVFLGVIISLCLLSPMGPIGNVQAGTNGMSQQLAFNPNRIQVTLPSSEEVMSEQIFPALRRKAASLSVYVAPYPTANKDAQGWVESALNEWFEAGHKSVNIHWVESPREAQISVIWVKTFPGDPYQAGEAETVAGKAKVSIKTSTMPENLIRANLLHELGHALGISGHSPYQGDVMAEEKDWKYFKTHPQYQEHLSGRDKMAISHLYSLAWFPNEDLYSVPQIANE